MSCGIVWCCVMGVCVWFHWFVRDFGVCAVQLESEGVSIVLSSGPIVSELPAARLDAPFSIPVRIINGTHEVVDATSHTDEEADVVAKVRASVPVVNTTRL
jgi:hypothetical protein